MLEDKERGSDVWLVDFGVDVPVADRFVNKAGSSVRHLLLSCAQSIYRLENIFEGYWVPVVPFVFLSGAGGSLAGTISLKGRNLVRLFNQMCYQVPRGPDPYQDRWTSAVLLDSTHLETPPVPDRSGARFHELKIRVSGGRILVGFSAEEHLSNARAMSDVLIELRLASCRRIATVSENQLDALEQKQPNDRYGVKAVGMVAGLWWPDSRRFSMSVSDRIVVVDDYPRATGVNGLCVDDRVEVLGSLEFFEKTPFGHEPDHAKEERKRLA